MGYGDHSKPNILWWKIKDVPNQQINSGYDGYILGADVAKNDDMDYFFARDMEVSWNRGTPKSSILVGFSIIKHPFLGSPICGNPHMNWHVVFFSDFHRQNSYWGLVEKTINHSHLLEKMMRNHLGKPPSFRWEKRCVPADFPWRNPVKTCNNLISRLKSLPTHLFKSWDKMPSICNMLGCHSDSPQLMFSCAADLPCSSRHCIEKAKRIDSRHLVVFVLVKLI